jgi:hypothetical protein
MPTCDFFSHLHTTYFQNFSPVPFFSQPRSSDSKLTTNQPPKHTPKASPPAAVSQKLQPFRKNWSLFWVHGFDRAMQASALDPKVKTHAST